MQIQTNKKILASSGGYAIIEKNKKLFFVNYNNGWLYTFNFVLIILVIIFLANGIVQLITGIASFGIILTAIAIILFFILIIGIKTLKKSNKKTFDELSIIAIIDLHKKEFLDEHGKLISSLNKVQFNRTLQMFSSSLAIEARWSGKSKIIARGNPFDGGSSGFTYILKSKGLMK